MIRQRIKALDHLAPAATLLLVVFTANTIALAGFYRDDPALFVSKLATGLVRGPIPGFPNWFDPNIGYTTQALGHLCAQDWLRGVPPWWDPYQGVGAPLAAELQNGAFFLPFSLLLHFNAGWLMLRLLMQAMAGLFTYALLIQLRLSRLAALLGGVMFGCSSTFILLADAPSNTLPFLPLLLLGIELGLTSHRRFAPGWSLVIIAIAYSFYGGFPETGFLADLFGGLWFAVRLTGCEREAWPPMIGRFAVAIGIGIALTLPGLVPFVQYVEHGFIGIHAQGAATASLPSVGLTTQILPQAFGPFGGELLVPHSGAYPALLALDQSWLAAGGWIGLLPITLGIAGLWSDDRTLRRLRWLLLIWVLIGEARIFGLQPVVALIALIPAIRMIVVERYAVPSIDFAFILLGAMAFDHWQRVGFARRAMAGITLLIGFVAAIALIIGASAFIAMISLTPSLIKSAVAYLVLIALACVTLLYGLSQRATRARQGLVAGMLMLDAIGGFGLSQAAGMARGHLDLSGVAYLRRHQGLQRAYSLGPLAPNYGSYYRVAELDMTMLPMPKHWALYIRKKLNPFRSPIMFFGLNNTAIPGIKSAAQMLRQNLPAYQALGVRYILTPPYTDPLHSSQNPVFISKAMWIYRLDHAAPYFATTPDSACAISMPKRTSVRIQCAKPGALIRRELFYPGWHARVNGHAVTVRKAAPLFQQIDLPAGRSKIRFFYRPPFERRACAAAGLGLLLWLALVLMDAKRRVVR
ncbi:hypothetical protein [Acidiphilium sp. MT5]